MQGRTAKRHVGFTCKRATLFAIQGAQGFVSGSKEGGQPMGYWNVSSNTAVSMLECASHYRDVRNQSGHASTQVEITQAVTLVQVLLLFVQPA